ncbi:MAG: phosphate/phosphite/phosphonate ABC transporter substrate-binding protein [Cellvibrionaceae bacterium]|nr:phosphate/phosphite/phosphonate ABC transporter substrate-binding protein [Cellvibrionaceae bacterium]
MKPYYFLLLFLVWLPSTLWANDKVYSFGVVPQQSAKRLAQLWTPVLSHLSTATGIKFQFKTAKNIPEFEKRLAAGDYDFAYMNPYHFTVFNRDPGYQAVAVRKNQPIRGIVVVHKDSPLTTLSELAEQQLAFPSPAAFAASLLPRAKLSNDNIPFTARYVSSHDSVYLGVAKGLFPAGGGVMRTFNNTDPKVRSQLKVLWTTAAYTPHAIAAHPSIKADVINKIQAILVDMYNSPDGKTLLQSLKIKKGLIVATDSDWDDVRSLGLDVLERLIKQ